jgi:hypothetical protein
MPGLGIVIGVLMAVISVLVGSAGNRAIQKFMETAETATAAITDIRELNDSHVVMVSFTAKDGVEREVRLDAVYTASMRVGDAFPIYYDPLDPARIKTEPSYDATGVAITTALGLAFIVIGICAAMKERGNMQLRANGERYEAMILGCSATAHVSHSSDSTSTTYTYVLTCEYRDGDGIARKCRSRVLSEDPRPRLPAGTVTVFVVPGKPRKYFVDVDGSLAGSAITAE